MAGELTREQIVTKIEKAFLPHRAKAEFREFGAKIIVGVWSAKDNSQITIFSSSLVHELQIESFLDDWTSGLRREVNDMIESHLA